MRIVVLGLLLIAASVSLVSAAACGCGCPEPDCLDCPTCPEQDCPEPDCPDCPTCPEQDCPDCPEPNCPEPEIIEKIVKCSGARIELSRFREIVRLVAAGVRISRSASTKRAKTVMSSLLWIPATGALPFPSG